MKNLTISAILVFFAAISCTSDRVIPEIDAIVDPDAVLIHYWNFNGLSGTVSNIDADDSLLASGATITYPGEGSGYMDDFNPGYTVNVRNGDIDGSGFRARNPSDTRSVLLSVPTTGFKNIIVQFATSKTSSGASIQNYSYTTDGTAYTTVGMPLTTFNVSEDTAGSLVTLDFTEIEGVVDNANFKIKIDFGGDTASGATGNNRFDNLTVEGVALPSNVAPNNLTVNGKNL